MSQSQSPTGVVLLYLGGPRSLEEVRPFLLQLFSDRDIIRLPLGPFFQRLFAHLIAALRGPRVRRHYAAIGGGSPLGATTARQAGLLQAALAPRGDFRVAVAMRYASPRAADAVATLAEAGVRRCVALPLYPQFSRATTGSSFADLDRAIAGRGVQWELTRVRDFHSHPLYLDALAAKVEAALSRARAAGGDPCVVFSAHSLPQRLVDEGDPYETQVRATVAGVAARLGLDRFHLGFQSRSGPVRWLQPEVVRLLDRLIDSGEKHLVVVPVSFVSDHIETLHEIDLQMRAHCLERGAASFVRSPSLNDDPHFIGALAQIVIESCPNSRSS
jgi:ferrochelatase